MKALRFRLYPNPGQEQKMLATLEACRHLWNDALAHRKRRWEEERMSVTYNQQQWILTAVRRADLDLQAVYSQTAQDVLHRLDIAFRSFFSQKAGCPKFKKFSRFGSFTYPQAYNGSVKPDPLRKRLYLSKVGSVKTVFHRPLPRDALMKTCTVVREACGEWYASLVYEDVVPLQGVAIPTVMVESAVGVDLGLMAIITISDGKDIPHPKFLRRAEKKLKHLQRELSRKQEGSRNREKARIRLAKQHARVARQRADNNHKLSRRLLYGHSLVGFEDLRISNMVRNHALAKSIQDAGWGQLIRFTEYKATESGARVVRVESAYSTQECFWCGALNGISLDQREFACVGCGRTITRDVNAARVVLKRALAQVGQGMPELKPVETEPLRVQTTGRASPVFEAGTEGPGRMDGKGVTQ